MSEEPTGIVAVVIAEGTARPLWRLVVLPAGRLWLHSVQEAVRGDVLRLVPDLPGCVAFANRRAEKSGLERNGIGSALFVGQRDWHNVAGVWGPLLVVGERDGVRTDIPAPALARVKDLAGAEDCSVEQAICDIAEALVADGRRAQALAERAAGWPEALRRPEGAAGRNGE